MDARAGAVRAVQPRPAPLCNTCSSLHIPLSIHCNNPPPTPPLQTHTHQPHPPPSHGSSMSSMTWCGWCATETPMARAWHAGRWLSIGQRSSGSGWRRWRLSQQCRWASGQRGRVAVACVGKEGWGWGGVCMQCHWAARWPAAWSAVDIQDDRSPAAGCCAGYEGRMRVVAGFESWDQPACSSNPYSGMAPPPLLTPPRSSSPPPTTMRATRRRAC